jgi:hypothetical protein
MQQLIVNVSGGLVQDIFCSNTDLQAILVDWDTDGIDPQEPGIVSVSLGKQRHLAYVTIHPVAGMDQLAQTDVSRALQASPWPIRTKPVNPSLTGEELATILAALRLWQQQTLAQQNPTAVWPQFHDARCLSIPEIDELCEKLNTHTLTLQAP